MGVGVSPTPRPPLRPGKTRYPLYRRLGGPQGRSGRAENFVRTGIRSQTIQPVAQSLYRLSYPAHSLSYIYIYIYIYIHLLPTIPQIVPVADNVTLQIIKSTPSVTAVSSTIVICIQSHGSYFLSRSVCG